MKETTMANTLKQRQQWLMDSIYVTSYNDVTCTEIDITETLSDAKKLQFIADCIYVERFKYQKPTNIADAIANHLQGLPSWLNIPFSNWDILELANSWGYDISNDTKADKFLSNYWNCVANLILQLFNKHKITLITK